MHILSEVRARYNKYARTALDENYISIKSGESDFRRTVTVNELNQRGFELGGCDQY